MWIAVFVSIVIIVLAVVSPGFRIVLLVLLAGVGVVGAYLWVESDRNDRFAKSAIRIDQIALQDVALKPDFGSWKIEGLVANNSGHTVEGIEFDVTLSDCEGKQSHDRCRTVGRSPSWAWVVVPPRETRSFSGSLSFDNLPAKVVSACSGTTCEPVRVFNYTVKAVRAKPQ